MIDCAKDEHLAEDFRRINPSKSIPTLLDTFYITNNSRCIANYLINTVSKKNDLHPKNLYEWSAVEEILTFNEEVLSPLIRDICVSMTKQK